MTNNLNYKIIAIMLSVIVICIGFCIYTLQDEQPYRYIDYPEEYQAISKDSLHPDVLGGYVRNDTLFLTFQH